MASPLNIALEIIVQETQRLLERSNDDLMDLNDVKRLESLVTTYAKIKAEIRTTKKQSVLENKNTDELLDLVKEAMKVLDKNEPKA